MKELPGIAHSRKACFHFGPVDYPPGGNQGAGEPVIDAMRRQDALRFLRPLAAALSPEVGDAEARGGVNENILPFLFPAGKESGLAEYLKGVGVEASFKIGQDRVPVRAVPVVAVENDRGVTVIGN